MTRKPSICLYLLAILAGCLFFLPATSLCTEYPAKMPVTLLDLYRQSDAIFEARYDKTREGEVVREDEGYAVVRTKKYFDVYSTLKGSHSKFFVLAEEEYKYRRGQTGAYLLADSRDDAENTYGLRSGDTVLLFLKYGEDGKTLELTDDEEGLKKLSSDDLTVYQKRIEELGSLLSDEKVSAESIVDWLIRCAEEPATRWEAAFELVKEFERLDWRQKQATRDAREDKRKVIVTDETDFFDSSTFARVLTVEQKRKLADILLDRKPESTGEAGTAKRMFVRGDRELIDLIKHWGDPRLAGFLIDELKTKDLTDYRRSETMRLIAGILGDPRIVGLADKYNRIYRDEANAAERNEVLALGISADSISAERSANQEYQEMRASVMTKFIRRADNIVTRRSNVGN